MSANPTRRLLPALLLILAVDAGAQSLIPNTGAAGSFAIRNATVYPVTSAPMEKATIVISGGKITDLGTAVSIPADAEVIDGTGLSVYPGLIDSGTHVGVLEIDSVQGTVDSAELGDVNPNARTAVALNPHSNVIAVTRANGVTTVLTEPAGGVISGQSALVQMRGWTPAEMTLVAPVAMHLQFPRLRTPPVEPSADDDAESEGRKAYDKQLDKLRALLRDAQAYGKASAARTSDASVRRFDRDLHLEALVPMVDGKLPVVIHANSARDIRAALNFADEFKLRVILSGARDVSHVLPELQKRSIPVLLGPVLDTPAREDDPYDLLFTNAATLHKAGVPFAIRTGETHNARNLPYHAAASAAFGLPKDIALAAITIGPARIFGVADRIGSLERGKQADLIVTDGDPLEITTNVKHVFIAGEKMPVDSLHTELYEKFRQRPK